MGNRTVAALNCLLAASASAQTTLASRVVGVTDGDTLTLLDDSKQHKIRLDGIDTPESRSVDQNRSMATPSWA